MPSYPKHIQNDFGVLDFAETHESCVGDDETKNKLSLQQNEPFLTVLSENLICYGRCYSNAQHAF